MTTIEQSPTGVQEPPPRRRRELRGAVAALLACRDREVLVEGPAGTGKTHGILAGIHADCWRYPGCRILICRDTRVSMTESVLKTWEEQILCDHHPAYSGKADRANRHSYRFPNGSVVVVAGLDNPDRLYSTEWDKVYVAEAHEISEDAWERLGRAMRNNRMPFQQRIADCNPAGPAHWLNRRADPIEDGVKLVRTREDYDRLQLCHRTPLIGRMRRLASTHQDNPAYWDWRYWGWTARGKEYVMGVLANLTGHRRARLFEGRWTAAAGTVFPEFDALRHSISPFDVPESWPWFVGIDPGYDHPCAILWFTISPNGTIYIADELYRGGKSIQEHAADMRQRNRGRTVAAYYGDPQHAFSSTAQSPRSISQQFRECGFNLLPWPRTGGNSESMVENVRKFLSSDRLKVFTTCPFTRMEFETWSYRRTAKGELPPGDDRYEDANNHAMDVVKGVLATGLRHDRKSILVIGGSARVANNQTPWPHRPF